MIVHWDIEQLTEEWFKLKWGKVGGSTSKGLFMPSDTLLLELLAESTEDFQMEYDSYVSDDMKRGIDLEPKARAAAEKYLGVKFKAPGWMQCEDITILGISPDGITDDLKVTGEFKCPGAKKHISTVYNNTIPADNIHQSLHYFTVNPFCEKHLFVSFRPESNYPFWAKLLTRESIIDLGTKAKPNCKSIDEWVKIAKFNAMELQTNLQTALKNLEKI